MKSIVLCLDSVQKVKSFVNIISTFDGDLDLSSERYVVDAKSIMGIFSLDLSKNIQLNVHDEINYDSIRKQLSEFVVR
jgi:phosphotransferase system HPr-like phosphotransfer protein